MEKAIQVTRLVKRYPGFALDEVSFSLEQGFVMALIGPNGSGKTTIIKTLLNLIRPDSGEVTIFGLDPAEEGEKIRQRIGFVHEVPHFYNHLSLEVIKTVVSRFYRSWNEERFQALAPRFELPLDKRFGRLSRGMKMKTALLLALSHEADLLILDEPTTGLDPVFRQSLLDLLRELLQDEGKSVLFTSHITGDIERIADYVTYLRKGQTVFSSRLDDIRQNWGVVKGGPELLEDGKARELFRGHIRQAYGIQAVTDRYEEAVRTFREPVVVKRATLEDILFLMEGKVSWKGEGEPWAH